MTTEMNKTGAPVGAPTVSHMLGEMTWLLTQSPLHRALSIGDLEWLIMRRSSTSNSMCFGMATGRRARALGQVRCEAEAKLDRGMIEPANRLSLEQWRSADRIWLVDLIAPFANAQNKHREVMLADLIAGPLKGRAFNSTRRILKPGSAPSGKSVWMRAIA
ncbi:toxin-activating lysine-acyltransferase [Flavisphingomonas formosensis]|uniref:toxin-activating lysine-acyltransferase n=1 Tax=Flavisphingomonas formosensis TaxID=861534 RepID=UPI0012FCF428|nr:toxin-activating lysine-acyltransferase [Sphingomonas formosensis]